MTPAELANRIEIVAEARGDEVFPPLIMNDWKMIVRALRAMPDDGAKPDPERSLLLATARVLHRHLSDPGHRRHDSRDQMELNAALEEFVRDPVRPGPEERKP